MNENIQNIFEITSVQLSPFQIMINLIVCLICTFILNFIYKSYSKTATNKLLFVKIFPIYTIAIFLIITVIQSSIALSLGLVGALSIIRFRTAIKEPEQLIYLLMCTGVGIGAAANQLEAVLIGTVIFGILSFFTNKKYNEQDNDLHSGQLFIIESKKYISPEELLTKLKKIDNSNPNLISFDTSNNLNIYTISIYGNGSLIIDFFKNHFPETNISFVRSK